MGWLEASSEHWTDRSLAGLIGALLVICLFPVSWLTQGHSAKGRCNCACLCVSSIGLSSQWLAFCGFFSQLTRAGLQPSHEKDFLIRFPVFFSKF